MKNRRPDGYYDLFPALITGLVRDAVSGMWHHAWIELVPARKDLYSEQPGARGGTLELNYALELNNQPASPGTLVWMRHRDEDGGVLHYEFDHPGGLPGGGVIVLPPDHNPSGSGYPGSGDCDLEIAGSGVLCIDQGITLRVSGPVDFRHTNPLHVATQVCPVFGEIREGTGVTIDDLGGGVYVINAPGGGVGPAGPQGDPGPAGPAGSDGTPGSVWRDGTGAPSSGLGINGDYYLDTVSGDVYQKAAGSYSVVGNILGPTGATGATGSTGPAGPNTVTAATTTDLTGYLKGDGANVSATATVPTTDLSGTIATAQIADGAVTLAKQANVATSTVFYRKTAGSGAPEVQTLATLKTDLGLTGTNTGDQTITLTGDVTGSGFGSFTTSVTRIAGVGLGATTAGAGNLLVGDGTVWVSRAVTGDVTFAGTGATTIGAGKVTNAMLAGSIDWTKVSKAGSSLADLATRSAADLSSGTLDPARLPFLFATKSADQSVTNSATLVDDADLQLALAASSTYLIEGVLYLDGPTGNDARIAYTVTSALTSGVIGFHALDSAGTTVTASLFAQTLPLASITSRTVGTMGVGNEYPIFYKGVIATNAATTFKIQFAQGTAGAGTSARNRTGAYLTARKVA